MQAAKIQIRAPKPYALQHDEKGLVRFRVHKIVSVRTDNSMVPKSDIYGRIDGEQEDTGPYEPAALKGFYDEHVELVAQAKEENRRRDEARAAEDALRKSVAAQLRGLGVPCEPNYNGIELKDRDLAALAALLLRVDRAPQ
jgi:hypothetical protein